MRAAEKPAEARKDVATTSETPAPGSVRGSIFNRWKGVRFQPLTTQRFRESGTYVQGPWRYEEIDGATHWLPLDAPGQLNDLLLEWLR
jgi:pimeloyl-ACP methyl ester carboxylesterase